MKKLINKEISWLSFNERVLNEAEDSAVPLIERIRFLGIFSSNMDEFFRIRVAILQRLTKLGKQSKKNLFFDPQKVLKQIQDKVLCFQKRFEDIYRDILEALSRQHIHIVNETELNPSQAAYVKTYFQNEVRPKLTPIIIDQAQSFPDLKDHSIYLAVVLKKKSKAVYALIEIPTNLLPRFVILPQVGKGKYIILLDDVIRFGLDDIFSSLNYTESEAYTVKLTRDAELEIESDISESYIRTILKSVKQRKEGNPVRFVYDAGLSKKFLQIFIKELSLDRQENIIPGGRYHNFRDFINFPDFGISSLRYEKLPMLPHKDLIAQNSLFHSLDERDSMIFTCYQSFDYLIDILREAAIEKDVISIKMTIYRAAQYSSVLNALINAAKNGKKVTVVLELQARFDEVANINWADRLQEGGVNVIFGIPDLKVHSKLCLITFKRGFHYAVIGTGNFNEDTAKVYSDVFLFTADRRLTNEVDKLFEFFRRSYKIPVFRFLIVSPYQTRKKIIKLIQKEIHNVRQGKEAFIILKLNNLVDPEIIENLYQANRAGVKITLIIRGMFSIKMGIPKISDRIDAFGIVDKYLEHARIFVFGNAGNPQYFISSADMMTRNLDSRVEVTCPIYNKEIQEDLRRLLEIQCSDNVKARTLDTAFNNRIRQTVSEDKIRAQISFYNYLKTKHLS